MTTAKAIGDFYEQKACAMLLANGYEIVARNFAVPRVGEIDIIATHHQTLATGKIRQTLVFVEVRARKRLGFADGVQSITYAKQQKIIKTAMCFLQQHDQYKAYDCRFDVIAFDVGRGQETCQWLDSAFLTT